MTTRSVRVAPQHVEALNSIDLAFEGGGKEEDVRTAWKAYPDVLNNGGERNPNYESTFIELLFAMGEALGRKYDRTYLKNSWYRPQAHVDSDTATLEIQRLFLVLKDARSFPVMVREAPFSRGTDTKV